MKPSEYESQGAEFDQARHYRYRLWRMWGGGSLTRWRTTLWIMLNPSTADEDVLDPTLRRCENFSKAWGYDGFEVANLFALRSTDPRVLTIHPSPVCRTVGTAWDGSTYPTNDIAIREACGRADLIICGWGKGPAGAAGTMTARVTRVRALLQAYELFCLGMNQDGSPKHPLYLAASTPVVSFPGGVRL